MSGSKAKSIVYPPCLLQAWQQQRAMSETEEAWKQLALQCSAVTLGAPVRTALLPGCRAGTARLVSENFKNTEKTNSCQHGTRYPWTQWNLENPIVLYQNTARLCRAIRKIRLVLTLLLRDAPCWRPRSPRSRLAWGLHVRCSGKGPALPWRSGAETCTAS